ncbi:MAG: nitroreductase family protein [Tissierellia bacterium]|nr:nitroreductase family protein [Tissierellia bacterium]
MLMSDFLLSRKSVRVFKNKKLSGKSVKQVEALVEDINKTRDDVRYELCVNGKDISKSLEGKAGYGGVMIDAPAYIAMHTLEEKPIAYLYGAYYLEKLITELKAIGLASCWVTLLEVDEDELKSIFKYDSGKVKYILAVGYPPRELNIGKANYSSRIGIEEYVFKGELGNEMEMEELEELGLDDLFYYLRMAPSSYNRQPWRFVIDEHMIKLYTLNTESINDYVDIGIVIYYFNALAGTIGMRPNWDIEIGETGEGFEYIGQTQI